jgi:hypothetical protein
VCWDTPVYPGMVSSLKKEISVPAGLGKKWDSISKITREKRVGGMTQVVEHLPVNIKPWFQTSVLLKKKFSDGNLEDSYNGLNTIIS